MRCKIFTILATLILTVIILPPLKVKAQSLVEVSLGLSILMFGVGEEETTQIFFAPPNPSHDPQPSEDPLVAFNFLIEVSNVLDGSCRQTFEKTLLEPTIFGLPMLNISYGFDSVPLVTIDDGTTSDTHELLPCFDSGHIAVLVGVPVPPNRVAELTANPNMVPVGVRVPAATWSFTVGSNEETRAAASTASDYRLVWFNEFIPSN